MNRNIQVHREQHPHLQHWSIERLENAYAQLNKSSRRNHPEINKARIACDNELHLRARGL